MDLNQIVNELDRLRDSGTRVPGFRGKIMVEIDKLRILTEELKSGLPSDLQEAQAIITQKESIISQANLEADRIRSEAENTAQSLNSDASVKHEERVSESEVLKEAHSRGEEIKLGAASEAQSIIQEAQRKAYGIVSNAESAASMQREGADRYSMEVLSGLEENMAEVLNQVRRGIDSLRPVDEPLSAQNGVIIK